jgi:hypothetical membrane protein
VTSRRLRSTAGPAAAAYFIATWIVAGLLREGYDPVENAISRLAEQGAPNRWIVTSGMAVFGVGALLFAPLLRRHAALAISIAGLASLGVAAFPCSAGCPRDGTTIDLVHAGFAALFYISFTATPVLQSRTPYALAISIVAAVSLSLHGLSIANGLMQRIGVTTLDLWLIYTGVTGRGWLRGEDARSR